MLEVKYAAKYFNQSIGIENISLNVEPGEIIGLFGENGAGKTTLLKAVMGLLKLDSGEVLVDGESNLKAFKKLSFITEEGSWFPDLTPAGHCEFFSNLLDNFDSGKFYRLLEYFSIAPDRKAGVMSKGQCSKLEAAIGFCKGAGYILMDEPFAGKDIFTRRDFLKMMIGSLTDEAVIIATHMPDEISAFITRAVIIRDGRIVQDTAMETLENENVTLEEYIRQVYRYDEKRVSRYL
jgi:ABC-2 type transport system ATP-binding protein